jgi:DNA polymerase-3 subunit gamma/tau
MALALYRKYRPKNFDDLVGQESIRITILEALKRGKLSHAYLFSGPRGTGKTSTARLVARAIQCKNRKETGEACESCETCQLNIKNELIDLIEIDAASNRGIDDIRELREKIRFAPSMATSKVYIIDEVHMLSKEAFNALLKSLEEPPSHVYFILATTEINKIPETIISRCQRYEFKRISDKYLVERLKHICENENIDADLGALEMIAKYADGGMRDAVSLLEQFSNEKVTEEIIRDRLGLTNHQYCDSLYGALGSGDAQKGIEIIATIHREGYNLQDFATSFLGLLRNKLHEAVYGQKQNIIPKILNWIEFFDDAWVKLKHASISELPLEIAIIRATQGSEKIKTEEIPQQTKRQEGLVHIDAVKAKLPQILHDIENSALRQSFQTGNLVDMNGKVLKFLFSSQFHFDKVNGAEGIGGIQNAFQKYLGTEIKVICELDPAIKELGWDLIEENS